MLHHSPDLGCRSSSMELTISFTLLSVVFFTAFVTLCVFQKFIWFFRSLRSIWECISLTSRPRPRRKSPTGRAHPTLIPISTILFECFDNERSIECVYSRLTSGAQCKGQISQKETDRASAMRRALAVCYPDEAGLRGLLNDYAANCMCKRHRNLILSSYQQFWTQQLDVWMQDIGNMLSEDMGIVLKRLESLEDKTVLREIEKTIMKALSIPSCSSYLNTPGRFPSTQNTPDYQLDGMDRIQNTPEPFWLSYWDKDCKFQKVLALVKEEYEHRFDCLRSEEATWTQGFLETTNLVVPQVSETDFTTYPCRHGSASISDIVQRSLTQEEMKDGRIYIYRYHTEDRTLRSLHLKIGYTTKSVDRRLQTWSTKCGYKLEEVHTIKTSHAKRVESLIHKELEIRGTRRWNNRCRKAANACNTVHDEWFELDEEEAIRVVTYWVKWMDSHTPYSHAGCLEPAMMIKIYDPVPAMVGFAKSANVTTECTPFVLDSCGQLWTSQKRSGIQTNDQAVTSRFRNMIAWIWQMRI